MARSAPPMRHSMETFVPTNGDLVIRDNLAGGLGVPMESYRKSGHLRRPATMGGYRFGKLSMSSFFTRHNPHPRRVNHFKGLLDVPICTVNDVDSAKRGYELEFPPNNYTKDMLRLPTECINTNSSYYPVDTLTGLHYFHPIKDLPFGQQRKTTAAAAPTPTESWRTELQELAKAAGLATKVEEPRKEEHVRTSQYSAATGRLIPPPSKALSRSGSRSKTAQFLSNVNTRGDLLNESNMEDTVMMMLCQILQTEDVDAVQSWLGKAGDNEKNMVQELIRAAVSGKTEGYNSQYPLQEYVIGMDGLPMTPDIGTVIGDHVQNRLSTAADDDVPPVPEPTMRPPSCPGPPVEEVVSRINQFSPRIPGRTSQLPPIAEADSMANNAPVLESFLPVKSTAESAAKPLPAISPKNESFNKALENITRRTLESLSGQKDDPANIKKFTVYPLKNEGSKIKTDAARLKLTSAAGNKPAEKEGSQPSHKISGSSEQTLWKPQDATVA